jgi:NAD(P)-dependent dehydrogenase (short-subunit alcohol dehydrogenase family)
VADAGWGVREVRDGLETAFRAATPGWGVVLLGTLVDGDRVLALVRSTHNDQLHRIASDVEEIRVQMPAETLEQAVQEVLFRSLNPWTLNLQGVDDTDVSDWA